MKERHLVLSNSKAVFGWAFVVVWFVALALGTPSYLESRRAAAGLGLGDIFMGGLWAFGVVFGAFFLRIPRTSVHLEGTDLVITERWIAGAREHRCTASSVQVVLDERTDTDGLAYFVCRLTTPSGHAILLAEGHRRDDVDARRREVLAVIEPSLNADRL